MTVSFINRISKAIFGHRPQVTRLKPMLEVSHLQRSLR